MNSIKISSIAFALALVVMFSTASTAFADNGFFDGGYEGGFFDGGYEGGFFDGGYSGGFFDGGYEGGFFDGGYEGGFFDGGYEGGFFDGGWETGFYGDSYHPGYIETDSYHPGYIETDSYHPGYIETDSYHPGYIETDSYFPGYTDTTYAVYDSFGQSYSIPSFGAMTIVPPGYSMPTPRPTPSYPVPQPPRPTPPAPTPTTNNNCVNNSCNNTNTNINNINTNTNVTTVAPATPGPIIQYVAPQYPTYYNQAPYCYITIGQGYYSSGMITLTWSSQGATSAYITPQVGQVAPNGSTSLYAYGNTIYSLTVTGPGGTYTCRTQSYVAPYAPVSPYVSLSQIPYTGISMGPIASALYWAGMIALATLGAYLLVYYKGGALALATSMLSARKRDAHQEATVLHEEVVAHAQPSLPTAQVSAMTRDAMKIVRAEDGTPRLVISRS